MPFACIYVADFPVEAILRTEPDLRSQAVALLAGKPPLQKVFALNDQARNMGIEPDMTKTQVEVCSGLMVRVRSPLQEDAAHAALLDCAQSFSPCVEDTAHHTVLLDLAGLELLFGGLPKIARDLARRASDLGLEANVAVAANPDAAMLAARGFSGVTVIPEGKEAEQLGNLEIEVLFRGFLDSGREQQAEEFLETLHRWGVRNLRTLAALPEVAIGERLGQEGVHLQKMARGSTSRTLVPVEPSLTFEEAIEMEYPVMLLEPLAFVLNRMLEQICGRLAARALATQELRLQLELENYRQPELAARAEKPSPDFAEGAARTSLFTRTLHLPVPMLDARTFLKMLQLDLRAHPPGAPILKIHLAVEPVRPRAAQGGLFLPPASEPEKLELTIARIAGIVGADRVGSLEVLDTHRPEGFRMQRFAPVLPQERKSSAKKKALAEESRRDSGEKENGTGSVTALRIFRPPLQALVTIRDGKPAQVECARRKEVNGGVIWVAGPWRTTGDWWEQEGWARDEWDIALQNGSGTALYRLIRDLLSGRWLVEGTYD